MTEVRTCSRCGIRIPTERIRCLPETKTCIDCSEAKPKTAADVDIDVGGSALGTWQGPDKDNS